MIARAPFAIVGACGIAVCALALVSPLLALVGTLIAAGVLRRGSRAGAILCVALALRAQLPEAPMPSPPSLRSVLAAPLQAALPEPDASIAVGTLLGGRGTLPREVTNTFARTGTTHLLAASGFNITLAATALVAALRPFGARPAAAGGIAAAVAFAAVAGLGPSIVRAALMAAVASAGTLLGRPSQGVNALGASVIALLFAAPAAVSDVGFLLSVSATAGLLLFARPLEGRLRGPAWLRAQLATTGAATFASLPISAEVFGRVPIVSPLANLAVAPLVAPLMTATAVAMGAGALAPPLALPPAWLAFALARALRAVVEALAALPFASVALPHGGLVCLGLYGLGLVIVRAPRPRLSRHAVALLAGGVLASALAAGVAVAAPSERPRVVALDVGQGDGFLLEAGDARALVDGGPDPARTLRVLGEALPPFSRRIEVVALTHSHADHGTGLAAVLQRYEVGLAIEPFGLEDNDVARLWHGALAERGVPLRRVSRGDRVRAGGLELEVLAPVGDPADPLPNLALRARAGGVTVALLGDASGRGQEDLLLHPEELRVDVYVPPHHGAATPYADALVAAAAPRVALISVGAGNRYGHPTPQTLRALAHVTTMRTDRDGTVEVSLDGAALLCRRRATALPDLGSGLLAGAAPCP